ncbi:unnamed protein product [Ilex paraguariensis]|uniref:Uncharacterized protein n=1 Tax=Ilex paraguariensis TaxID=185542 RepID=A0ABC8QX43_9AQUA
MGLFNFLKTTLPTRIMASVLMSLSAMESMAAARVTSRHRPLHTCGVSISAIVHKAYTKAQDFDGPIGSMINRIDKLTTSAFPLIHAIQRRWLAVLSFADDHILAVENVMEALFPPSARLFNQIDKLIQTAEALPGKFDDVVNKFPIIIRQIPFLDWALVHLILWLNFLISTLTHWGSHNTREKEIVIDISCNNLNNDVHKPSSISDETKTVGEAQCLPESPSDSSRDETMKVSTKGAQCENVVTSSPQSGGIKCSYKEILEKGTKGSIEKTDANKSNEDITLEDPILELFEASWHMNPGKVGKGNSLARFVSDT